MTSVFAVDPGYERSAFVEFDGSKVVDHAIEPNGSIMLRLSARDYHAVVFEQIEGFGMPVGREVFETVFWTGRMYQEAFRWSRYVDRISRKAVKLHLCQSVRAQDASIRVALLDRFGGSAAKGTKKQQGPLYGLKSHEWSALALAITWWDTNPELLKVSA